MPISASNSRLIYHALKACGIGLVAALPETWLIDLVELAAADPEMILVQPAREEEGVGITAGAHLAGMRSALILQNHGLLASLNGIVSLTQLYRVPLLMLISYRGDFGEKDPWQTEGGRVTEPVLDAVGVPWRRLERPGEVEERVARALDLAESSLRPVALLLGRELLWED